jgi:predicted metal-dependent hydrolase
MFKSQIAKKMTRDERINALKQEWLGELDVLIHRWAQLTDIGTLQNDIQTAKDTIESIHQNIVEYFDEPKDLRDSMQIVNKFQTIKGNENPNWSQVVQDIKSMRNDINNVPTTKKLEKLKINLEPFKRDCFNNILDMREEIASFLNNSLSSDIREINNFMIGSQSLLQSKPETFEEIDQQKQEYDKINGKYPGIEEKLKSLDTRVRMIKDLQLVSSMNFNLPNLRRKWDNFSLKFSCFSQSQKAHQNNLLSQTKQDLKKMDSEIDKFY